VAVPVVDPLEAVHVAHDHGEVARIALDARGLALYDLVEAPAVEHGGEGIDFGEALGLGQVVGLLYGYGREVGYGREDTHVVGREGRAVEAIE
jgi:hypothetical protein